MPNIMPKVRSGRLLFLPFGLGPLPLLSLQLAQCVGDVGLIHNVVPLQNRTSTPAGHPHDDALGHAGAAQVAGRRAAVVMDEDALILPSVCNVLQAGD